MAKYLDELEERGYAFYFSVTITGSPTAFEPHSPALPQILRTFQQFASRLGPERMRWRYDPIVISSLTPDDYHLRRFEEIAAALQGATNHCTFSFVQYYGKTSRNLESSACQAEIRLERPALDAQQSLAARLAQIAARYGMRLHTCCNDLLLTAGISKSHCVDADLIRDITTGQAGALKGKPTRKDCGCAASVDIGMYDTCLFGCAYCYATNHHPAARLHHAEHDPRDSLLWRPARLRGVDLDSIVMPRKEG